MCLDLAVILVWDDDDNNDDLFYNLLSFKLAHRFFRHWTDYFQEAADNLF